MAAIPLVSAVSLVPIQELVKTPLQRCTGLTNNPPDEDEVNILARRKAKAPTVPQTTCFTELPAEIRNRIYGYVLPSEDQELIVATPFEDEAMAFGNQPAITRVSRQLRSETLEMFYTNSNFVACIKDFDFIRFIHWARCTASSTSPVPKITIHVKLLTRLHCAYELLELIRDWRDLDHTNLHLKIHNCYCGPPVVRRPDSDQRRVVVRAIHIGEELRAKSTLR